MPAREVRQEAGATCGNGKEALSRGVDGVPPEVGLPSEAAIEATSVAGVKGSNEAVDDARDFGRIAELHALLALTSDWSRDGQGDADCNQRCEAGSQH